MNQCVVCGAEIPEGRQVCPGCERLQIDAGRIINGLECCTRVFISFAPNPNCAECPYKGVEDCAGQLFKDMLLALDTKAITPAEIQERLVKV